MIKERILKEMVWRQQEIFYLIYYIIFHLICFVMDFLIVILNLKGLMLINQWLDILMMSNNNKLQLY